MNWLTGWEQHTTVVGVTGWDTLILMYFVNSSIVLAAAFLFLWDTFKTKYVPVYWRPITGLFGIVLLNDAAVRLYRAFLRMQALQNAAVTGNVPLQLRITTNDRFLLLIYIVDTAVVLTLMVTAGIKWVKVAKYHAMCRDCDPYGLTGQYDPAWRTHYMLKSEYETGGFDAVQEREAEEVPSCEGTCDCGKVGCRGKEEEGG